MTQLCALGYYGPVCSLCVRTEQRTSSYGRTGPLKCRACRHPAIIVLAYIGSTLLVLAWLSYVIHITLTDNVEAANGTLDPGRTSQLIRVCHRAHADLYATLQAPLPLCLLCFTTVIKQILYKPIQLVYCIPVLDSCKRWMYAGFQSVAAVHESVGACEHPHPPHGADPLQRNQPGLHHHLQRRPVSGLPANRFNQSCSPRPADPPGSAITHAACSLCHTAAAVSPSCC